MNKFNLLAIFTLSLVFSAEAAATKARLRVSKVLRALDLPLSTPQLVHVERLLRADKAVGISAYQQKIVDVGVLGGEEVVATLRNILTAQQQDARGELLQLTKEGEIARREYLYEHDKQLFSIELRVEDAAWRGHQGQKELAEALQEVSAEIEQYNGEESSVNILLRLGERISAQSSLRQRIGDNLRGNSLLSKVMLQRIEEQLGNSDTDFQLLLQALRREAVAEKLYEQDSDGYREQVAKIVAIKNSEVVARTVANHGQLKFYSYRELEPEAVYKNIDDIEANGLLTEEGVANFIVTGHTKNGVEERIDQQTQAGSYELLVEFSLADGVMDTSIRDVLVVAFNYRKIKLDRISGEARNNIEALVKVDGEGEVLPFSDEVFQKDLAKALRMVEGVKYIDRRNYRKKAKKIRSKGEIIVDSERLKTFQNKLVELEQELGSDDKGAVKSEIKHIFTLAENNQTMNRIWLVYLYHSLKGYKGYELYFHNLFKEAKIEFATLQLYDELYALYELLQPKDLKGSWDKKLGEAIGVSSVTLRKLAVKGVISEGIYNTIEEKLAKLSAAKKDESSEAGKLTPEQKENFLKWLASHIEQRKNDTFEEVTSVLAKHDWQQSITEMINTASELTSQSNRTKESELGKIYSVLLIAAREANDDKKQQIKKLMGNKHFIEKIVRKGHLYALFTDLKLPAEGSWLDNFGGEIGVSRKTIIRFIKKGVIGEGIYNKIEKKLDELSAAEKDESSAAGKLTPEQKENFLNWLASHIDDYSYRVKTALAEHDWQQSITEMIDAASELTSQGNRTKENELGKIYSVLLLAAREANDDKKQQIKKLMGNKHFIEKIVRRGHLYTLLTDLKLPAESKWLDKLGGAIGVSRKTIIRFVDKGVISERFYNKIKGELDKLSAAKKDKPSKAEKDESSKAEKDESSAAGKLTPEQKENFLNWLASHIDDYNYRVKAALAEPNWQQSITEMINTASEITSQGNRTKENELGKIYSVLLIAAREANDDKKQQIKKLMGNKHFIEKIVRRGHLYALFTALKLPAEGSWLDNLGEAIGTSSEPLIRFVDKGVIGERFYNKIKGELDKLSAAKKDKPSKAEKDESSKAEKDESSKAEKDESSKAEKDESSAAGKLTPEQKENFLNWLASHIDDYNYRVKAALAEPNWQQSITEMINTASEITSQGNRTKESELGKIYSVLLIAAREANDDKKQQIKKLMGNKHFIEKIVRRGHLYTLLTDLKLKKEGEWIKNLGEAIGASSRPLKKFIEKGVIGEGIYNKIEKKLAELSAAKKDKPSKAGKLTPEQKENFLNWLASHIEQRKSDTFEEATSVLAKHDWQYSITEIIDAASEGSKKAAKSRAKLAKYYEDLVF